MSVLDDIVVGVLADLRSREVARPRAELEDALDALAPVRDPLPDLASTGLSVIAEVKRSSPSKGALADIADPATLAQCYAEGGASVISVLTEERRFSGSLADLVAVRARVETPVLRKDFIISEYQLLEARVYGADVALLIVAALDQPDLARLHDLARGLGLRVLVEAHDAEEVRRAVDVGAEIIGINARNLKTLEVDPTSFERLAPGIDSEAVLVAESGVAGVAEAARLAELGADAVLVGEYLVRGSEPRRAVAELIAAGRRPAQSAVQSAVQSPVWVDQGGSRP